MCIRVTFQNIYFDMYLINKQRKKIPVPYAESLLLSFFKPIGRQESSVAFYFRAELQPSYLA